MDFGVDSEYQRPLIKSGRCRGCCSHECGVAAYAGGCELPAAPPSALAAECELVGVGDLTSFPAHTGHRPGNDPTTLIAKTDGHALAAVLGCEVCKRSRL